MNTPVKYVSWDTETRRITYEEPVPALMCATFSTVGDNGGSIKTPWEHPIDAMLRTLWTEGSHTICHNTSFDLSIIAFRYPGMLPYIFKALDDNLIHDTLIREKLLNLTRHGEIDLLEHNGSVMRISYAQAALEKKYLNIDRSALKDDDDSPRLNYSIYESVPLSQWKEEWISYAVDDATNCGLIFQAQEIEREKCIAETGYDPYKIEYHKNRHAFALRLLECVGTLLDGERVIKTADEFRTEYDKPGFREPLLAAGFIVPATPPQPHANGAVDHIETCPGHKNHPGYKKGRKYRLGVDCNCPPKMTKGEKETSPRRPLFQYIWNLAFNNPNIKAWPSDGTVSDLKHAGLYEKVIGNGAFKHEIIASTDIPAAHKECLLSLEQATIDKDTKTIEKQQKTRELIEASLKSGHKVFIPEDISLTTNDEWNANFSGLDPLLSLLDERNAIKKIVTEYLPKMFLPDGTPAEIIRAGYDALKKTGRSSSRASKLYPSRSSQTVDPRVRPCTVPRPGNIICSTDISGMELGTAAQTCYRLFGFSDLRDAINAGVDNHAFLGAQIAFNLDGEFASKAPQCKTKQERYEFFKQLKGVWENCEAVLPAFSKVYRHEKSEDFVKDPKKVVTFGDFFKHYRTLAKPTGLGYWGGLGPATFVSYAKKDYGMKMPLETAKHLKEIWLATYTEAGMYLDHISKDCKDPNHSAEEYEDDDGNVKKRVWLAYDTPLGMHRPKCLFCDCANGKALQSPSAEGALGALYEVQKAVWLSGVNIKGVYEDPYEGLLDGVWVDDFIHDEILWEQPDDDLKGKRARIIEGLIVRSMERITPDVKAGAETAAMYRWDKRAESLWENKGTAGERLVVWEENKKA